MATLRRVVVDWNGATGLPGVSVFYTAGADDVTTNLGTWLTAIKGLFPGGMSWSIPSAGDTIESTTNVLNGAWVGGTGATVTATGSSGYAAGTGTYIRWITGAINNGRRVQGRTFLCPIQNTSYDSDGTVFGTSLTTLNTATATLAAANKLQTYHRPSSHGATDGAAFPTIGGICPDKVTSLKTRRR